MITSRLPRAFKLHVAVVGVLSLVLGLCCFTADGIAGKSKISTSKSSKSSKSSTGLSMSGSASVIVPSATRARAPLVRSEEYDDSDARGSILVRWKKTRECITIKAEDLESELFLKIYFENDDGALESVGSATANSLGQLFIKWDSSRVSLPLEKPLEELAGRAVLLATPDGVRVLEGTFPDLGFPGSPGDPGSQPEIMRFRVVEKLEPNPEVVSRGRGRVKVVYKAVVGVSKLVIRAKSLEPGTTVTLFVANPETGELEDVEEATVDEKGKVRFLFNTRKGDPLPFGLSDIRPLLGQELEIRTEADEVAYSGSIPGV